MFGFFEIRCFAFGVPCYWGVRGFHCSGFPGSGFRVGCSGLGVSRSGFCVSMFEVLSSGFHIDGSGFSG